MAEGCSYVGVGDVANLAVASYPARVDQYMRMGCLHDAICKKVEVKPRGVFEARQARRADLEVCMAS